MDNHQLQTGLHQVNSQSLLATRVWEMLQRTISVPDIASNIASEFGMTRDRALSQTRRCLEYFSDVDFDCRRL